MGANDFARLHLGVGTYNIPISELGFDWPPPERIYVDVDGVREVVEGDDHRFILVRTSMSQLTDADMEGLTHLLRGAEYHYEGVVRPNGNA